MKRRRGHEGSFIMAYVAEVAVHGGGRADADEDLVPGFGCVAVMRNRTVPTGSLGVGPT